MVVKGDERRNIAQLALYNKDTSLNYFNLIKNKKLYKIPKQHKKCGVCILWN